MRIVRLGLCAAAVLSSGLLVSCGASKGGNTTCSTDADCGTGNICHPLAKLCVQTCQSGSDCPSTAKTCDIYSGPNGATTGSTKICQCATDQLCGGGTGSTVICGVEDKICETKCGSNTDCSSSRTCDTTTGQCTSGASCNPACTSPQVCDTSTNPPSCVTPCTVGGCTSPQVCLYSTSQTCGAAASCNAANAEPDVCLSGEYCSSAASCSDVPAPTCPNFTPSLHANTWTPGSSAPIIYSVTTDSFGQNSTICSAAGTTWLAKEHVQAYWVGGKFPTSGDSTVGGYIAGALHYVKSDGSEGTATVSTTALTVTNGATSQADFHMFFCLPDNSTTFTGGLHFYVQSGADLSGAGSLSAATCTANCISGNETCFTSP